MLFDIFVFFLLTKVRFNKSIQYYTWVIDAGFRDLSQYNVDFLCNVNYVKILRNELALHSSNFKAPRQTLRNFTGDRFHDK